ncbi:MAG: cob(I)yrinic acid a,c-diamide adenosyltransferase [Lewinellaceae bacterium]|nr:cob(I)yrinic acid a,c-diamide adenosyltransferase [Lewinellaceae bacterium]
MAFRIYTKTGDLGETALFGGRRVLKSHLRVDAYGTVDELNSFIGWLRDSAGAHRVRDGLSEIQHRLFTVGAHLASDPEKKPPTPDLSAGDIEWLEKEIDQMDQGLPPLKNFILPGGHPTVSVCHVCRTVCRRAERLVVALHENDPVDPLVLQYLNRLSDAKARKPCLPSCFASGEQKYLATSFFFHVRGEYYDLYS